MQHRICQRTDAQEQMPNRDAFDCGRDNGYGRACDFEYAFTLMDVESGAKPCASGESGHLKSSLFLYLQHSAGSLESSQIILWHHLATKSQG